MDQGDSAKRVLGIEGGGTKTTWATLIAGRVMGQGEEGPGNTLLLSDEDLEKLLRGIAEKAGGEVGAIGAAFAGCQQPAEQARVIKIIRLVWPQVEKICVMEDTRSVLAAAFGDGPGIVVIAGTGRKCSRPEVAARAD